MKILVTNDDGINARGIKILTEAAMNFGEVYVVAPKTQQSAVSQGITIHNPISIEEYDYITGTRAWTVGGKPADCVKVAMEYLHLKPDLVLSGVNDGPNLGTDILYSGTVAAASEAAVFKIPAVAISTDFGAFDIVEREISDVLSFLIVNDIPAPGTLVNVNFPVNAFNSSLGFKFTKQGERFFSAKYRHDEGMYWQEGNWVRSENDVDSDVKACENGYISVSPLGIDRTDSDVLNSWKSKMGL